MAEVEPALVSPPLTPEPNERLDASSMDVGLGLGLYAPTEEELRSGARLDFVGAWKLDALVHAGRDTFDRPDPGHTGSHESDRLKLGHERDTIGQPDPSHAERDTIDPPNSSHAAAADIVEQDVKGLGIDQGNERSSTVEVGTSGQKDITHDRIVNVELDRPSTKHTSKIMSPRHFDRYLGRLEDHIARDKSRHRHARKSSRVVSEHSSPKVGYGYQMPLSATAANFKNLDASRTIHADENGRIKDYKGGIYQPQRHKSSNLPPLSSTLPRSPSGLRATSSPVMYAGHMDNTRDDFPDASVRMRRPVRALAPLRMSQTSKAHRSAYRPELLTSGSRHQSPDPNSNPDVSPIQRVVASPWSLPTLLHLEMSPARPSPAQMPISGRGDFPYESSRIKIERLVNFMTLPPQLEQVLWFGALACMDSWLYLFTILPLRFLKAVAILMDTFAQSIISLSCARVAYSWKRLKRLVRIGQPAVLSQEPVPNTRGSPTMKRGHDPQDRHRMQQRRSILAPDQKADLLKGLLISVSCVLLMYFDASRMYHGIRGQAFIKLYVIYNVLEVCDKLFSALGQDVLECLFSKETLECKPNGRSKILRPFWLFILALAYNIVHATSLFYQVITLNVAVNSFSNALLTLLISNQFVEIKSTVFKRFEKDNLFQLTCADVVERFQLWMMLIIIAARNIIEQGSWNVGDVGNSLPSADAAFSARLSALLPFPASFNWNPSWSGSGKVLTPFIIVLGSEMLVDWIKHAYITKFNNTRPAIYGRFLDVLCKDYYTSAFTDRNLTRRLGLPVIPLACLFIRAMVQTYHMFLATHMPPPSPIPSASSNIQTTLSSALTTSTSMVAVSTLIQDFATNTSSTLALPDTLPAPLTQIDRLLQQTWYRLSITTQAHSYLSNSVIARYPSQALDLLLPYLLPLTTLLLLFLICLLIKLLLGMALLSFARRRYTHANAAAEQLHVIPDTRYIGGLGLVDVEPEAKKYFYANDPEGSRRLAEKEAKDREKVNPKDGLDGVDRYNMVAKRIW